MALCLVVFRCWVLLFLSASARVLRLLLGMAYLAWILIEHVVCSRVLLGVFLLSFLLLSSKFRSLKCLSRRLRWFSSRGFWFSSCYPRSSSPNVRSSVSKRHVGWNCLMQYHEIQCGLALRAEERILQGLGFKNSGVTFSLSFRDERSFHWLCSGFHQTAMRN